MTSRRRALLLGFLVWIVPFVIGLISYPVRELWRALFESIMALVLSVIVVISASIYFKHIEDNYLKEGIFIGLLWFAMSILIDLPFFSYGPMKMNLKDYAADIGLTYVMIPTITTGFGIVLENFHLRRR
ncbi:MAG: hypothetical protein M1377_04095 [Deltaproteobacteria bacterium]|nr:hypothetical protein [Deltaproteobacteria bacterium]